tara:strand:- start:563 stop:1276 length:714 start_codon:yes stop_codon:yes gene_type:complete
LLKVNYKYPFLKKKKYATLHKNGFLKFHVDRNYRILESYEFKKFYEKLIKIKKSSNNLGRVIYNSADVIKDPFFKLLINKSAIKEICDDYFKLNYSLVTSEVWWGRPNFKYSGYNLFHRDRQHLTSLHFDLNLIDMFEGSGAVEVIQKDYSKKIKNYWGGEMVEKIDDITKYIPKKLLNEAIYSGYGRQGTIFCYNSMLNFHRGGICTKKERLILHICVMENVYWRKERYPIWQNIS